MKPARIALFLQLCFLAGIAIAATPSRKCRRKRRNFWIPFSPKVFAIRPLGRRALSARHRGH
jgi:hypothetical protein